MKKILFLVLLCLLATLATFIFKREGVSSSVHQLASKVGETVESVKAQVEEKLPASLSNIPASLVDLPSDTAFALVIPGKAIEPALNHINDFLLKVKSSGLGKKLELDKMLNQGIQAASSELENQTGQGMQENNHGSGAIHGSGSIHGSAGNTHGKNGKDQSSVQSKIDEALEAVRKFEKLDLLLRAKTLEGKSTPLLKVSAAFKDDSYSKQIQQAFDGLIAMSKADPSGPQFKKDEQDPQTYVFNIKPPMAPVEALARIKVTEKDLAATIGLIAGSATPTNSAAKNSSSSVVSLSTISKDSLATYFNLENYIQLIQVGLNLAPDHAQKEKIEMFKKALESSMGNYKTLAANLIFENGLKTKSCSEFSSSSSQFTAFKQAIDISSKNPSTFYKLIGPRTTFAARIDGPFLSAMFETMYGAFSSAEVQSPGLPSSAELLAQVKIAQEQLNKLKIKDIGLVANAPTVSLIPDVGIYLEHEADLSIEQFGAILQELFKKLAPPSIADNSPIMLSKDSNGQSQVTIPAAEGYKISFKSISPTQFFGSIQDNFTEEAKTLLIGKDSYLDDAKLASKGVDLKISDNASFYYLSTSSLMPLVRQMTPFITMAKPELKITDSELTQFLNLFDFNLLFTGRTSSPQDQVICSTNDAALF